MLNLKKYLIIFTILNLIINNKSAVPSIPIDINNETLKISNNYLNKNFTCIPHLYNYLLNEKNYKKLPKLKINSENKYVLVNGKYTSFRNTEIFNLIKLLNMTDKETKNSLVFDIIYQLNYIAYNNDNDERPINENYFELN